MAVVRTRPGMVAPTGQEIDAADARAKAATPVAAAAEPAPQALRLPLDVTFHRPRPLRVVLVGAGGTGARLGPDVARLLGRGDQLIIVDPDTVEERNLIRQHFVRGDVGKYKAEVVTRRAQLAAAAGVTVTAEVGTLTDLSHYTRQIAGEAPTLTVFLGCVDNRRARQKAALFLAANHGIWIDAGNELRGGQVGLMANAKGSVSDPNSGKAWPEKDFEERVAKAIAEGYTRPQAIDRMMPRILCNTVLEVTPTILQPDPVAEGAEETCGLRIDTQSLAANVMAYSGLINLFSRVIDEVPINTPSTFFSTSNTMTASPFKSCLHVAGSAPALLFPSVKEEPLWRNVDQFRAVVITTTKAVERKK